VSCIPEKEKHIGGLHNWDKNKRNRERKGGGGGGSKEREKVEKSQVFELKDSI